MEAKQTTINDKIYYLTVKSLVNRFLNPNVPRSPLGADS